MGGDHGPSVVAPGVALALKRDPDIRVLLHGDEAQVRAALARLPAGLRDRCEVRHAEKSIAMDEKPSVALRRGKGSSLWNAIEAIRDEEADACVSAGNTGALMAMSKLILRMSAKLERPAIVASWPTMTGRVTTVLDVGANVESDAAQLVEFAIMGAAFHHAVHGGDRPDHKPTIGLLNVGSEEQKGHDEVREAHKMLRELGLDLDYRGFVEGTDIAKGTVDVVVTDGFTGNVALKTAEGVARFISAEMKRALTSGPFAMLGMLIASAALKGMRRRLDPQRLNGAPLLGLNGIVVKSHGGTNALGFASAIRVAADLARSDFSAEIDRNMNRLTSAVAIYAVEPGTQGAA
jgi:glycerol-3-phosphate acyltransferase PlsX